MPDTRTEIEPRLRETAAPPLPGPTRTARGKTSRRRRFLLLALLVLGLIVAGGAWYRWGHAVAPDQLWLTATAERGDIEDAITALGTLQPVSYVDVGTQVSGQLKTLHVAIGDRVKAGDLLAEIDPTVYQTRVEADRAQIANLAAQRAEKEAQLLLARQQAERQRNLKASRATSDDALQVAEAGYAAAQAQLDAIDAQTRQIQSTLRGDEANLGYTKIYAPIDGTVVSQSARRGQTLNANQSAPIIVQVADLATMTVEAQVSEADVSRLRLGMTAYFATLGMPDKRWYGALRQVQPTPEVVNNVVLYNALFDVPNQDGTLMTQMTAQVFFVSAAAQDTLLVPVTALSGLSPGTSSAVPGRATVRVLKPSGSVETRTVTVGVTNRAQAEILSGLEPGEQVITGSRRPNAAPTQSGPGRSPRL
ncbi:efflux RND transporter periplasmic adaptor subunit [Inquilinus sp. CA228]|uniref:efflux RND transporter periplasmic adaptor subunit n=1 Tax=Inquilinus sp. CA228 TaxID=3455609 RepID=UPI003F8D61BC